MANRVTKQLHAAAAASKRLFQKGIYGPKVEEVAEEAHGGLWPIGNEEIAWVKKHIGQIRDILEEDDFAVCLVNKLYFSKYHRKVPSTVELAKDVLPRAGSFSAAGLHFMVSEEDTIWLALQEKIGFGGIASINKVGRNMDRAIKYNLINRKDGERFIKSLKNKVP